MVDHFATNISDLMWSWVIPCFHQTLLPLEQVICFGLIYSLPKMYIILEKTYHARENFTVLIKIRKWPFGWNFSIHFHSPRLSVWCAAAVCPALLLADVLHCCCGSEVVHSESSSGKGGNSFTSPKFLILLADPRASLFLFNTGSTEWLWKSFALRRKGDFLWNCQMWPCCVYKPIAHWKDCSIYSFIYQCKSHSTDFLIAVWIKNHITYYQCWI